MLLTFSANKRTEHESSSGKMKCCVKSRERKSSFQFQTIVMMTLGEYSFHLAWLFILNSPFSYPVDWMSSLGWTESLCIVWGVCLMCSTDKMWKKLLPTHSSKHCSVMEKLSAHISSGSSSKILKFSLMNYFPRFMTSDLHLHSSPLVLPQHISLCVVFSVSSFLHSSHYLWAVQHSVAHKDVTAI